MATFPWDCSAGNPPALPRSASPNSLKIQELIPLHPPGISRSPNFGKPPSRGCGFLGSRTGKAPVARWAGNCSHPVGNNLGMSVRARAGIPRLLFKRCGSFPAGSGRCPGVFGYFFLPFFHLLAAWIRSRRDPAASAALISAFIWEPFFSWDEPGFVLSQKIWELPAVGLSR